MSSRDEGMCGINGIYDFNERFDKNRLYKIVQLMNEQIVYRGPDHEGMYQNSNLTMGMRRLAIIDLKSGNQPVFNHDKTVVIVFNGEIYNFETLRAELNKKYTFITKSDTEVIVHAYEEWGIDMLDKLDGMFAFSLYDINSQTLLLARDRFGEKPLYYYKNDDILIWGSELKSLMITGLIPKKINIEALNQFLQLTYIPAPLTIYENVYKLLPGHYLKIQRDGSVSDTSYWDIKNAAKTNNISYRAAKRKLFELVEQAVKERMVSDVPIGAFLSGGIDSSTIVGLMSQNSKIPIETFTIGFCEKEYDERDRAKLVSKLNRTNHHELVINYNDVIETIDTILKELGEPFADSSILPTYYVSKFAKQYVKVVLTGDAGDEVFLGYEKYLIDYYCNILEHFPKILIKIFKKIVFSVSDTTILTRKIRKVLNTFEKDKFEQRKDLMSLGFNEYERKRLLISDYYNENCMEFLKKKYYDQDVVSELKRTQYTDLSVVLEGDMLAKVDRMSMLNSLETRTPFLAREIVEFAYSLPDKYKLRGKRLKRIMKDTFKKILPPKFDKLRKSGFGIPLDYWFRNQLKDLVDSVLNQNFIEKQGVFQWEYIEKILREHNEGKINHKNKIWTLIVFQKWYINFFEG